MERRREIQSNIQENSLEHPEQKEKLHRNISEAELFMLWRDGELPYGFALPNNPDSDAEPNSILTYWFQEPVQIDRFRGIFIEIDRDTVTKDQISKGKMRFVRVQENYNGDNEFFDEQMHEVYCKEKIPLEKVGITVTDKQHEFFEETMEDIVSTQEKFLKEGDYSGIEYGLQEIIYNFLNYEFGDDSRNLPKHDFVIKEAKDYSYSLDWVFLHYYVKTKCNLYIRTKELTKLLRIIYEFYTWAATLPIIDPRTENFRILSSDGGEPQEKEVREE